MNPRLRKLIGTIGIVLLVICYAFLAMMVAIAILPGTHMAVQMLYYVFAGVLWALPAAMIIKWMSRDPDAV